jgi:hypothetical protein
MNRLWHRLVTGDDGIAAQGVARTGFIEGLVFSFLTSNALTFGLAGSALAISALTTIISIGVSVGLSLLAQSIFSPSQNAPRPEDLQQSSRQPTQPRARHYGRVKVSGPWMYAEAYSGSFHKIVALGQGPIDAIEEFWIDDQQVTLDSEGNVSTDIGLDGAAPPRIKYRLGLATETSYSELFSLFPEWDSEHRGDGIASLYALQSPVPQASYLNAYPNGINTNYRVVLRGAKIANPVTGIVAWGDNAADVILDYLTHVDGMRLPGSIFSTPLAQAGWVAAHERCNELVQLAGGGSELRYRLWGSYLLSERPADVLGRMLECCDGRLKITSDGGLTLDIGAWAEPEVVLDEGAIVGFTELARGRDILNSANTVRATFLDPQGDYQASDADPWIDDEDVALRGEIAVDKRFEMAPSHSQCRRLMKLAAYRANPSWVGTFRCNLKALAAFGERFVRIRLPLFLIDEVFEVQDFRFDVGSGGALVGVTLAVQSMPQAAYQWDPSQEEGSAPVADESEGGGVPDADAPEVSIVSGPKAELTFAAAPDEIYRYQARYRKTADEDWTLIDDIEPDATSVQTDTLAAETEYEFQLRLVTVALAIPGAWSASATETTT